MFDKRFWKSWLLILKVSQALLQAWAAMLWHQATALLGVCAVQLASQSTQRWYKTKFEGFRFFKTPAESPQYNRTDKVTAPVEQHSSREGGLFLQKLVPMATEVPGASMLCSCYTRRARAGCPWAPKSRQACLHGALTPLPHSPMWVWNPTGTHQAKWPLKCVLI